MRVFDYSKLKERTWDNEILAYVAQIHEYKGKQDLYLRQKPVELNRLIEIAKIQSTESSNQIEGIVTTNARLKQLVEDKTTPRNRDEEEILGYRNVLNIVHEAYEAIPVRSNYILQLHGEMLKHTAFSYAGKYKTTPNEIDMMLENGEKVVLFKPLEPYETPDAVERLCNEYNKAIGDGIVDPLILIPNFILDFLCIHPFNDGNGRMSRLLTLLLLYKAGYIVGKYISIEMLIEKTKETYYETLQFSSYGWHENKNIYGPFIKYYLGIIVKAYNEFETRVNYLVTKKMSKPDRIKAVINQKIGSITKKEIMESCPDISKVTVERTLTQLVKNGLIIKIGAGPSTAYIRRQ